MLTHQLDKIAILIKSNSWKSDKIFSRRYEKNMDIVTRAIWTIETSLGSQLTLSSIAEDCGVSQYHLSRVFRGATGMSVMVYVRSRRLSNAARVLAKGDADILDVALDTQYNSHEAFTRAFTNYFGALPSRVRESGCFSDLNVVEPFVIDESLLLPVKSPAIHQRGQFHVTGVSRPYTFETNYGIPEQWGLFLERQMEIKSDTKSDIKNEIKCEVTGVSYGVCYDSDTDGNFLYMTGLETNTTAKIPTDMRRIKLPAGRYAVYEHDGHISDFRKTNYTIWNKTMKEEGLQPRRAPDFELYDEGFDPDTGKGYVEIWIPIL